MAQAPAGGTVGMNGEFYAGGQFLPNTELPKRPAQAKPKYTGPRREMIAPYTWADRPEGMRSIYSAIVGTECEVTRDGIMRRFAGLNPAYRRDEWHGHAIDDLIARYNAGERWYEPIV